MGGIAGLYKGGVDVVNTVGNLGYSTLINDSDKGINAELDNTFSSAEAFGRTAKAAGKDIASNPSNLKGFAGYAGEQATQGLHNTFVKGKAESLHSFGGAVATTLLGGPKMGRSVGSVAKSSAVVVGEAAGKVGVGAKKIVTQVKKNAAVPVSRSPWHRQMGAVGDLSKKPIRRKQNGQFAKKPGPKPAIKDKPIHGNDLNASGPHDLYVVRNKKTGEVLRFGETGRDINTRLDEHVRKFKKDHNYTEPVLIERLKTVEGKAAVKELETRYNKTYQKLYKKRPPFNFNDH